MKDKAEGALAQQWSKVFPGSAAEEGGNFKEVDVAAPLGALMAVKDEVRRRLVGWLVG